MVIHKQNGGLSDARNAGIDAAHGAYIMFVDSDDFIANSMVEKLYSAIVYSNAEMGLCSFLYVDEKGIPINAKNDNIPIEDNVLSGRQAIKCLIGDKGLYYSIAWCKLYKMELFKETYFPVGKQNEDEFVVHIIFGKCDRIACIKEPLYYYVQRSDSIMGKSQHSVNIMNFDKVEALVNRAEYVFKLGLEAEAGKIYFNAVILVSFLLVHFKPRSSKEKTRVKEVYQMVRDNRAFGKYCTPKEPYKV